MLKPLTRETANVQIAGADVFRTLQGIETWIGELLNRVQVFDPAAPDEDIVDLLARLTFWVGLFAPGTTKFADLPEYERLRCLVFAATCEIPKDYHEQVVDVELLARSGPPASVVGRQSRNNPHGLGRARVNADRE
jgi:hypothetical protein